MLCFQTSPDVLRDKPAKMVDTSFCQSDIELSLIKGVFNMKATGIVRRIDDLGRVVIPKEIRRTMRIREGDPSQKTLEQWERFCGGMLELGRRLG